jgi:hypothetical protein
MKGRTSRKLFSQVGREALESSSPSLCILGSNWAATKPFESPNSKKIVAIRARCDGNRQSGYSTT